MPPSRQRPLLALLLFLAVFTGFRAEARDILVGAYVNSISAINPADGTYNISVELWFIDPEGTFDPRDNLYVLARSSAIRDYYQERGADGRTYTSARVDAVVDQEFRLTDFPFDEQNLLLRVEAGETIDRIRFVPDAQPPQIADYVALVDWTLSDATLTETEHGYTTRFGLADSGPQVFSQLELRIAAARTQTGVVVDDFLGFIFSFIITGLIYFVPTTELGTRIGMTTGSLFAALLNLNRLLDAAGYKAEFGLVEQLGFLIFGAILCSLLISIAMKRVATRKGVAYADRIDAVLGVIVMTAFLAAIVWVIRAGMS
ncbi:MAG: hypothetical protein DI556_04230 [Rhodovulum sulfidophilum]|uniref:Neurotransmitter-gated ion-channel ligand-binding domain-containing protein n=1 Tax=Rhodovulum sulfidophilum TaxID=35806 RepID=A0A2W5Q9G9_RHOSU|nr:MAG: hypothetical protein DI556_04230 [Rhodovulum sulfidophilum]